MYKSRKTKLSSNKSSNTNRNKRQLNPIGENVTIEVPKIHSGQKADFSTDVDVFGDERIPASQEPTQRYLSQRSGTICRTQSKSLTHRPANTYFELMLIKAGVNWVEADNFVLTCDHVVFVSRFREILVRCQNYPDNIKIFKTGLKDALSEKAFSRSSLAFKLLCGCTINIPGEDAVYQSQDSMMFNFLMIDFLRDPVVNVLLEKIADYAQIELITATESVSLLPLLLSQLRYVVTSHKDIILEKISGIFVISTIAAKWDIIESVEVILHPDNHDSFTEMLLKHFPSSKEFFQSRTIRTLTNLCLTNEMKTKLRQKIMAFIEEVEWSSHSLPLLIKFLMKVLNDDNEESIRELVLSLREIFILKICPETQNQIDLFNIIYQGFARSKLFFDSWQKTIQSLPSNQFRSVDLIMLLGMISTNEERGNYIEILVTRNANPSLKKIIVNFFFKICRRIRNETITVNILYEAKAALSPLLELHANVLVQILPNFLRSKYKLVENFGKCSFGILFSVGGSIQKLILKKLVELTCDKSTKNLINISLELLKDLNEKHASQVQNWAMMLMPLLDRISEMTLVQTRMNMELLCSIAYPAPKFPGCLALQDQIEMMVKKQIINRVPFVKKQGIVGTVQLINGLARFENPTDESANDLNESFNSVSDLPDGRSKSAANYIVRIHSTMRCAELFALFCDELASVCSKKKGSHTLELHRPFVIYLTELITYYFQNSFVTENIPDENTCVPLSFQKCINSLADSNAEDNESELPTIAINISGLVFKPQTEAINSIIVLAPLFNLMRVLHFVRYEGSLELINALLGCAIVLPTFFDENIEHLDTIFYDYDERQCKLILHTYFHTINWFREIVSSFSTQQETMIRSKVLVRLTNLIELEERFRYLLTKAPVDYTPPNCQFSSPSKTRILKPTSAQGRKTQRNTCRKRQLDKSEDNSFMECNPSAANGNISNALKSQLGNKSKCYTRTKSNFNDFYGPKELYRQMNSDIMLILRETLNITHPLPEEDIGKKIGVVELRFILSDIISKVKSITGVQKMNTSSTDHWQHQYLANASDFMMDLGTFFPHIVKNMELIGNAIMEAIEKGNGFYCNADLFTEAFNYYKICFGQCIKLFAVFFSWSDLTNESGKNILRKSLLALMETSQLQENEGKPTPMLAALAFEKFFKFEGIILELKSAVFLYHLLLSLRKHSSEDVSEEGVKTQQDQHIRSLCKIFLCRKWHSYDGSLEKGALCNEYLNELVKGFLKDSDFRRQKEILKVVLEESQMMSAKDSTLRSFPNFKKTNFPILFRGLCEILIISLKDMIKLSISISGESLKIWEKSCELLNILLEIVKALNLPRNFSLFLKFSHLYLKLVLQHGLQVFEVHLVKSAERVSAMLKNLQVTTRFLHNLCCHSKALKVTTIVVQIPYLRQTIENLVFRVKALLAANKCSAVFWMGNLKNKDLHGDEILSQCVSSLTNSEQANESDEDVPDDDVSVDETILDNDDGSIDGNIGSASRSKCF